MNFDDFPTDLPKFFELFHMANRLYSLTKGSGVMFFIVFLGIWSWRPMPAIPATKMLCGRSALSHVKDLLFAPVGKSIF